MRYVDHVELLRMMTKLDLEIFGGYMAIQLALGSLFLTKTAKFGWLTALGILILDAALAMIAWVLLRNNALRRKEAIGTLKNVMTAMGFYQEGAYLADKAINEPGKVRLWGPWYRIGVLVGYVGLALIVGATFVTAPNIAVKRDAPQAALPLP